jgi:chromatin remodeling complex protein RSC6
MTKDPEFALSAPLAAFVGAAQMSRPGVVKKIWEHVRTHNLQKPTDRRFILCDAPLKSIFDKAVNRFLFIYIYGMNVCANSASLSWLCRARCRCLR